MKYEVKCCWLAPAGLMTPYKELDETGEELLKAGWEPFAVDNKLMWFRRAIP